MILLYLSVALNNTLFAGLSGRLFEAEAYTILCGGGWFPLRNLDNKKQVEMHMRLSETRRTIFNKLHEVDLNSEWYWQPFLKNFPSLDDLMGPRSGSPPPPPH